MKIILNRNYITILLFLFISSAVFFNFCLGCSQQSKQINESINEPLKTNKKKTDKEKTGKEKTVRNTQISGTQISGTQIKKKEEAKKTEVKFKITERSLEKLEPRLLKNVITKLRKLQEQQPGTEEEFEKLLKDNIGNIIDEEELQLIKNYSEMFYCKHDKIPQNIRKKMIIPYKKCPQFDELVYFRLSYWGYDGIPHRDGELIVHKSIGKDNTSKGENRICLIFGELFEKFFPIGKMKLIHEYTAKDGKSTGDDNKSMKDNNTSAFNCRKMTGKNKLSKHAYGRAIDINPLFNPMVTSKKVYPYAGNCFAKNRDNEKDMEKCMKKQ